MSEKKKGTVERQREQSTQNKAQDFITKNNKVLTGVAVVLLIVVLGLVGYTKYYIPQQEAKAQEEIYMAQMMFERDSFQVALNGKVDMLGTNNVTGFLEIADKYGATKTGNLARYYAGVCNLRLGQFDQAITQLKKYSPGDDVTAAMAAAAMGDAQSEQGNMDAAIKNYRKAVKASDNQLVAPMNLLKLGLALENQGKAGEALEQYERIKNNYPESLEAQDIEKHIARLAAA